MERELEDISGDEICFYLLKRTLNFITPSSFSFPSGEGLGWGLKDYYL
jgi:hypothetical protein